MIDICDFAVGQSRQLYGLTMHSERPNHRMYEQYHPLGVVGIISAFNFPVAVWCWNTALAWIAGDVCVWKPSEKAPLCSIACQHIWNDVAKANDLPAGVSCIVNGDYTVGEMMTADRRVPLVSATGSIAWAKSLPKPWPLVSDALCWSWAETTPSSSRRKPTSKWSFPPLCLAPSAPAVNAAHPPPPDHPQQHLRQGP